MVGIEGIEPSVEDSESSALPLGDIPSRVVGYTKLRERQKNLKTRIALIVEHRNPPIEGDSDSWSH